MLSRICADWTDLLGQGDASFTQSPLSVLFTLQRAKSVIDVSSIVFRAVMLMTPFAYSRVNNTRITFLSTLTLDILELHNHNYLRTNSTRQNANSNICTVVSQTLKLGGSYVLAMINNYCDDYLKYYRLYSHC